MCMCMCMCMCMHTGEPQAEQLVHDMCMCMCMCMHTGDPQAEQLEISSVDGFQGREKQVTLHPLTPPYIPLGAGEAGVRGCKGVQGGVRGCKASRGGRSR